MNYDTITIESLADDCFRKSGYKINKADLINRITHLCENHKSEVNVISGSVSLNEQGEATVCQWCAGTGEFCENKEHTDTEYDPIVCEVHCFECDKPKK